MAYTPKPAPKTIDPKLNTLVANIWNEFRSIAGDLGNVQTLVTNAIENPTTSITLTGASTFNVANGLAGGTIGASGIVATDAGGSSTLIIDFTDGSIYLAGTIVSTDGAIGGFTIGATDLSAASGGNTTIVSSGATAFSAGPTGSPTVTITQAGVLSATGASITGAITATSGAIGGFDIGADYIRDAADSFGLASTVTGGNDVRFWAGDTFTNRASAPNRQYEDGSVVFTNANITGAITATSGTIGSFTIGTYLYTGSKTAWNDSNAGVHIGSDGIGVGNNVFTVDGSSGGVSTSSIQITGGSIYVTGAETISGYSAAVYGQGTATGAVGVMGGAYGTNATGVQGAAGAPGQTAGAFTGIFGATALYVSGPLTGTSTTDIAINTNKFTVAASSGNTVVAGTLTVGGSSVLVSGGALGTPSSGTLSSCSGYPASALTGSSLPAGITSSSLTSVGTLTGLTIGGNLTQTSGGHSLTAASTGIEIGAVGTSNTPYIDFHSSSSSTDYDSRLISSGGTGVAGNGTLNIQCGTLQWNSSTVALASHSHSTYTPDDATSGSFSSTVTFDMAGSLAASYKFTMSGATVQVTDTSDISLKHNVFPEELGLGFVRMLNPVTFEMNSAPGMRHHGFIAQDNHKLLGHDNDGLSFINPDGLRGTGYLQLISPMVKSIQEMAADLDNLRLRVMALESPTIH